jgi:hypothetical protein
MTTELCDEFSIVDLVFVLDSSGSLGIENWNKIKRLASSVVEVLPISESTIRFVPLLFH